MTSTISTVAVLGGGVLGSQIAYQAAYAGFEVTVWDIDGAAIAAVNQRFARLASMYDAEIDGAKDGKSTEAIHRLTTTTDLASAVGDVDLVIEAVPENPEIKTSTWQKVGKLAGERTIFCTNSSTLLPSSFMEATGRPEKFLALHFANHIAVQNTAEIMGTERTDPDVYATVVKFAEEMGMVPIPLHKEQPGYVLNSLLVPFLQSASALYVKGVADPETIDKTWKIATGSPKGPFEIYDIVGLRTAFAISSMGDETAQQFAAILKEQFIDKGKLGLESGAGFYNYA